MSTPDDNASAMSAQYGKRDASQDSSRYSLFNPVALQEHQARLSAMLALWREHGWTSLADKRIVEVGCGGGGNLLELLRLGAQAPNLAGWELLAERVQAARACLPSAVTVHEGDASAAPLAGASVDMVLAFTVFSSILDNATQTRLAQAMWSWLKPGGGVLWYDFAFNNPRNADVRGMPVARVRELFPQGRFSVRRLTLAPPLARAVAAVHPRLLPVASSVLYPARTHRLIWIAKTAA
jgi:SAM-dependent methyltransferase